MTGNGLSSPGVAVRLPQFAAHGARWGRPTGHDHENHHIINSFLAFPQEKRSTLAETVVGRRVVGKNGWPEYGWPEHAT
jgi:hypothetical protein